MSNAFKYKEKRRTNWLSAEIDQKQLNDVANKLGKFERAAPAIISRALNEAARGLRMTVTKEPSKLYTIKRAQIKKTLNLDKAKKAKLSAGVVTKGAVNPMTNFKVSPKTINPKRKSQLKVQVLKSGTADKVPATFMTKGKNEETLIMREGEERTPTQIVFGPSTPQIIGNDEITKPAMEQANERYHSRLKHHINYYLSRKSGGG